ncbi:MAG: transglutaminase family protein [Parachlamydiales bacterium]|jgi:tetratricopeptide (TPR) repeat protein
MQKKLLIYSLVLLNTLSVKSLAIEYQRHPSAVHFAYKSLPSNSLKELLAFSVLYPETQQGQASIREVLSLLMEPNLISYEQIHKASAAAPDLIRLSKALPGSFNSCSEEALEIIENASGHLLNRRLAGYGITELTLAQRMAPDQIDLARALLLAEMGSSPETLQHVRCYEAALDWMALQILLQLGPHATHEQMINAINAYLFQVLHYRFPAYRKYAKQIQNYSLLGKVIEARQGVCLGVSLLFACLAQRVGLPLQIITPPGHIFLRYETAQGYRNIETTAGGIHLEDENYLGIELEELPRRTVKETIGLAHLNTGSTYWQNGDYDKALEEYAKAKTYMGDDPLLQCFTGFCLCLSGRIEEGKKNLMRIRNSNHPLMHQTKMIAADFLDGRTDVEALKLVYVEVDKVRTEQEKHCNELMVMMERCPQFRAGWMKLAMTWMDMQREDKAIEAIEKSHQVDPNDLSVEYFLAQLSLSRQDYIQAWKYLLNAEKLAEKRVKPFKPLKQLRSQLSSCCAIPEN